MWWMKLCCFHPMSLFCCCCCFHCYCCSSVDRWWMQLHTKTLPSDIHCCCFRYCRHCEMLRLLRWRCCSNGIVRLCPTFLATTMQHRSHFPCCIDRFLHYHSIHDPERTWSSTNTQFRFFSQTNKRTLPLCRHTQPATKKKTNWFLQRAALVLM